MKRILIVAVALFFYHSATAQNAYLPDSNGYYKLAEQMPVYPGGNTALLTYIQHNINYPRAARIGHLQGRVVVRFVVDENGAIKNVTVPTGMGLSPECDAEAIRVVKSMPAWTPGKLEGKNVPVWYTIPINYKLGITTTQH